jgi:hypothetical protein
MSMNLKGRNIEYLVKVGARSQMVINITDSAGNAKSLTDTDHTYYKQQILYWQMQVFGKAK